MLTHHVQKKALLIFNDSFSNDSFSNAAYAYTSKQRLTTLAIHCCLWQKHC